MSNKLRKITTIIVTFNSEKNIKEITKLPLQKSKTDNTICIIDNNSTDRTREKLSKLRNIDLTLNKKNIGFAKAVNQGIKSHPLADYYLLLNPDVKVSKSLIDNLIICATEKKADIVGGKTLKHNGKLFRSFVRRPNYWTVLFDYTNLRKLVPGDFFHKQHYYLDKKDPSTDQQVDVVSGAMMLISSKVIKKIGYFDESFFMYLEDIDFCNRAIEAGFKILYCIHAVMWHEGGGSSRNKDRINHAAWRSSRIYYVKKYFSGIKRYSLSFFLYLDDIVTFVWLFVKRCLHL